MTLTLDEVRQTRFHMARRAGYEVTDVDNFVDKVEATIMALTDENETLKQQLSSVHRAEPSKDLSDENARLRRELENARAAQRDPGRDNSRELDELRRTNDSLRSQLSQAQETARLAQQQADQARSQAAQQQREQREQHHAPVSMVHQDVSGSKVERIVVTTAEQASPAVVRLVQLATQQAEQLVTEAEKDAQRKIEEANRQAHEITIDARTRAERVESEARVNAEKLTAEARSHAENLEREVANKRIEMFSSLEGERDHLRGRVDELRNFEQSFRNNLTQHLKGQIEALDRGVFEPDNKPGLLSGPSGSDHGSMGRPSSTPRLDALLGDHR